MADDTSPSALPRTKQPRAELSTQRLLDAAASLIAEQGYERTTLAEIGRRAGYSHGLVTQRFGSKEGLLAALVEYSIAQWNELVPVRAGQPERVTDIITAVRRNLRHDPVLLRGLYALLFESFKPIPIVHEQNIESHRDMRDRIAADVRRAVKRGTVRKVDARHFGTYVLSALRGLEYQWLMDPEGFDLDKMLKWLSDHVSADLTPD